MTSWLVRSRHKSHHRDGIAEQFLAAFSSVIVSADPHTVCAIVGRAVRARPDLADRIVVAAITFGRPVRGYSKDFKQPIGKEIPCEWVQCILQSAIAADPSSEQLIINAALAAAPMLRDCILAVTPCPGQNAFNEAADNRSASDRETFAGVA